MTKLRRRRAFTLIELLITIAIIGIMASMALFAMATAQETARADKTKALVAKLDAIVKAKYEAYRTRRVPINPGQGANPAVVAQQRLNGLHFLMSQELPERTATSWC